MSKRKNTAEPTASEAIEFIGQMRWLEGTRASAPDTPDIDRPHHRMRAALYAKALKMMKKGE